MKQALIDTDIISYFLRKHSKVAINFEKYLNEIGKITLSIISYYEIISGLKFKDAKNQLNTFIEFTKFSEVLPITMRSAQISSDIYSDLRKKGDLIDDIDILIAGIALANDMILVTHNLKHFKKITKLEIQDWTKI